MIHCWRPHVVMPGAGGPAQYSIDVTSGDRTRLHAHARRDLSMIRPNTHLISCTTPNLSIILEGKLVFAISSPGLLHFEEENTVFERDGDCPYQAVQLARLDEAAKEGVGFPLVKKLLAF